MVEFVRQAAAIDQMYAEAMLEPGCGVFQRVRGSGGEGQESWMDCLQPEARRSLECGDDDELFIRRLCRNGFSAPVRVESSTRKSRV